MEKTLEEQKADNPKFRALLVEDQPIIQFIHINFLQNLGCCVRCAENGEKALEMLNNTYDIVFLDMGLPDITGVEVVKSYRKKENEKRLPIVALTAHGGYEDKKSFIEAGVDEVIVKPVTIQQLDLILQKYCECS